MTIDGLYEIISRRIREMPENSYVTSLFTEGEGRIVQKMGEEAIEVIIAAKDRDRKRLVYEVAD